MLMVGVNGWECMVCGGGGRIRLNLRVWGSGLASFPILGSESEDLSIGLRVQGLGLRQVTSRDFRKMPGFNFVNPPFQIFLIHFRYKSEYIVLQLGTGQVFISVPSDR